MIQYNMSILWNIVCLFFVAGYLGYTSGFSLTCMVFFLISVSSLNAVVCVWAFLWKIKRSLKTLLLLFNTLQYFCLSFSLSHFWFLSSPVCHFNFTFVFPRSSIRSSTSLVLLMVSPTTLLQTYLLMVNVKPNTSLSTSRSGTVLIIARIYSGCPFLCTTFNSLWPPPQVRQKQTGNA